MTPADTWIERWIDLMETQDRARATELLAPEIKILAYQSGEGGPLTTFDGVDAVYEWITKPSKGRFVFKKLLAKPGPVCEGLPEADLTVHASYRVHHPESDFTNTGHWEMAIVGERIVGLLHAPKPLED